VGLKSHPSRVVEEDELTPHEVSHRLELLTQLRVEISLLEMGNASGPELESHAAQTVSQAMRLADSIETLINTCGLGPIGQQTTHRLWARLDPLLRSTFQLQLRESVAHILSSARHVVACVSEPHATDVDTVCQVVAMCAPSASAGLSAWSVGSGTLARAACEAERSLDQAVATLNRRTLSPIVPSLEPPVVSHAPIPEITRQVLKGASQPARVIHISLSPQVPQWYFDQFEGQPSVAAPLQLPRLLAALDWPAIELGAADTCVRPGSFRRSCHAAVSYQVAAGHSDESPLCDITAQIRHASLLVVELDHKSLGSDPVVEKAICALVAAIWPPPGMGEFVIMLPAPLPPTSSLARWLDSVGAGLLTPVHRSHQAARWPARHVFVATSPTLSALLVPQLVRLSEGNLQDVREQQRQVVPFTGAVACPVDRGCMVDDSFVRVIAQATRRMMQARMLTAEAPMMREVLGANPMPPLVHAIRVREAQSLLPRVSPATEGLHGWKPRLPFRKQPAGRA
jgi:hypothetical protein